MTNLQLKKTTKKLILNNNFILFIVIDVTFKYYV